MKIRTIVLATTFSLGLTSASYSQTNSGQSQGNFPEACRAAVQASGHAQTAEDMQSKMSQVMQSGMQGMMGQMNETQKGLQEAMMKMNGPMMMGMMAKDADVAWICAMIAHHQGAIDMARAGLKGADNAESKKLAEETIQSNQREIEKLIAWVEKNAARESKNESSNAPRQ